ncbi:MAG TPA: glycosyltransferase [Noviherbaspirillum sp.]
MAQSPHYQRALAIARRIYHALPLSAAAKLRLRRLLMPYLHVTSEVAEGGSLMKALSRAKDTRRQLEWDGEREAALRSALIEIGRQVARTGPVTHMIVLPFLATGGAERVALNFAQAVRSARPDSAVLLIVADRPAVAERVELPEGVALLVLDARFEGLQSYEKKQWLLEDLIRAVRPQAFHNINSEVAWQLILARGERLSTLTRVFASIFAFQFAPNGKTKTGYAAYFLKPGLPHLVGLLSDNQRFVRDAAVEYALDASERNKMHAIYNPVRTHAEALVPGIDVRLKELASRHPHRRLRILWAGRLDEEKRIDLLLELITQAEFADFDVYGQAVVDAAAVLPSHANASYKGPFASPEELVQEVVYDAFVFTSRWEGMPNILLEVGALGVPVIAPTVGGVGELISDYTGYPLPERPDVADYLRALQQVRVRPQDAAERALTLKHLIERRHSWSAFSAAVGAIPGYLDHQQSVLCTEKV